MTPSTSRSSHQTATSRAARRRACFRAMLLATSALASAALSATAAQAQTVDATWLVIGSNNDFNNGPGNWGGGQVPTGTATFVPNTDIRDNITFTQNTTLGGMTVTSGAGDFSLTTAGHNVTFNGLGLTVGSSASLTFNVNGGNSAANFFESSTAGQAAINVNNNGLVEFFASSKAGSSTLNVGDAQTLGTLQFTGNSNAEQANINIKNGLVEFLISSKGGSSTLNVGDPQNGTPGALAFNDNSSADQAKINVSAVGTLNFNNNSSAANATITMSGGDVVFANASTAGNASITIDSGGTLIFGDQSTAGHASVNLLAGGALDISFHETGIVLDALVGSGDVFLGSNNLTVGANGASTTFSGGIHDGTSPEGIRLVGPHGGTGGSLTKEGTGSLTLSGANDYTGETIVNGGALIVDGAINLSSSVTVNAGGTLGGTGFVPTTTINAGGTLAPGHNDDTSGVLQVLGNLTFSQVATYLVQISPFNTPTRVLGTATLGGARVAANFTPGATVTKGQSLILDANNPLTDTFNPVVKTNLSPIFKVSLSYDSNDVFLNVDAAAVDASSGLNTNQRNVANATFNAFTLAGGNLPPAFATLSPANLTQLSGETAVGTQQATFDAMNQFVGVLLDPTRGVRGGGPRDARDAMAAMPSKATPLSAEAFDSRWGVWVAGFGGSQSTSGDNVLGSNKTSSNVFGSAVGVDYHFSPSTVAGFALAGGGTHFIVDNGGRGNSDLFQAGAYVRHTQGAAFIAAALAYGWQDVTTNRTVTVFGIDSLRANFNSNAISGRLEGGYRVATAVGDITPYAAGQFTTYRLPSYAEQTAFGANTFALAYTGKDVTATRSELGLRGEKAVPLTDATLMLRGRLAWAHDFNTDRNVQAVFQTLPGSAFVVNGASPAADTALTTIAAETLWRNGWSASLTADAQLSDTTHSYSGKGVVRYNW